VAVAAAGLAVADARRRRAAEPVPL
jgi:hypothetical protein